jgi:MFS family permease
MENTGRSRPRTPGRSRSRSRPRRSDNPPLHRILSSQFPDDHSVYHHEDGEGTHIVEDAASMHQTETERRDPESSSSDDDVDEKDEVAGTEAAEEHDEGAHREDKIYEEIRGGIPYEHDVEAQPPALEKKKSTRSVKDPNLVTWDSDNDPKNPKNCKQHSKSTFMRVQLLISSRVHEAQMGSNLDCLMFHACISDFLFNDLASSGFDISRVWYNERGRSPVDPFNLRPGICDWTPVSRALVRDIWSCNRPAIVKFVLPGLESGLWLCSNFGPADGFPVPEWTRWICSIGHWRCKYTSLFLFVSNLTIWQGVLSDTFFPEERGRAISIYSLAPLLGPAIGPIAGGFISQNTTWRWCFWATTIFTAMVQCFGFFFLQETYAPKLLEWKRDKLRKETGNMALHTEFDSPDRTLLTTLKVAMKRPFKLLFTQPIVQALACYMAYLYGLMYLMLSTFPLLWNGRYGESVGIGSLNFISMGLGFFLGTQITAPLNDLVYRRLKKKNNGVGKPEFRVPIMVPASLLVPIGLFWYGWSAQALTHWIVPNIGVCIFCAGVIIGFQCIQTYLVDSYTRYAASAIAAATVLRSLAGFGFPLFAPAMYNALDFGWGNSLLGFIALALGVPAPFMLWKFGEKLRGRSAFAAG